jgi:hypothetical protein
MRIENLVPYEKQSKEKQEKLTCLITFLAEEDPFDC